VVYHKSKHNYRGPYTPYQKLITVHNGVSFHMVYLTLETV